MGNILVTGQGGAGKTAYVVDKILKICKDENRIIYTNINMKLKDRKNLKPLIFDEFLAMCDKFYEFYQENNVNSDFDNMLKQQDFIKPYLNSLIAWDEAHMHLDEPIKGVTKFMFYVRHMNDIDMYLISTNPMAVHHTFRKNIHFYVNALPAGKRFLSTQFRYKIYNHHELKDVNLERKETVNLSNDIKNAYDSGGLQIQKSKLKNMLIIPIFLIILLILAYKIFISTEEIPEIRDLEPVVIPSPTSINNKPKIEKKTFIKSYKLLTFICSEYCYVKNSDMTFSVDEMPKIAERFDMDLISSSSFKPYNPNSIFKMTFYVNPEIYTLFSPVTINKGNKNAKKDSSASNISFF